MEVRGCGIEVGKQRVCPDVSLPLPHARGHRLPVHGVWTKSESEKGDPVLDPIAPAEGISRNYRVERGVSIGST